jgi:hypothetical protein
MPESGTGAQPAAVATSSGSCRRRRGPAFITWPGRLRPSTRSTWRAAAQLVEIDAGLDAHLVQQVDQILGADVACRPGRERAAAEPRERRLVDVDALGEPGHDVDQPDAARVVKVQRDRQLGDMLLEMAAALGDERRRRHAGGVAERHAAHAEVAQPPCDVGDLLDRHLALERAAERGRDRALDRDAGRVRDAHDVLEASEGFLDRAIDVLLIVGLGGREEHPDLVDPGGSGAVRAPGVGHECGELSAARAVEPGQNLGGVDQLRHRARRHERGELDDRHPGADQLVDQRDLGRGRDELALDLEAVARPDLGHGHSARPRHVPAPSHWRGLTGPCRPSGAAGQAAQPAGAGHAASASARAGRALRGLGVQWRKWSGARGPTMSNAGLGLQSCQWGGGVPAIGERKVARRVPNSEPR